MKHPPARGTGLTLAWFSWQLERMLDGVENTGGIRGWIGIGVWALLASCSPPPADPGIFEDGGEIKDLSFFLRRLRLLDHLPTLETSHTAMASTWDRTGGNKDDTDFKRVEGDRNVLLDVAGPGCVHRLFTGLRGEILQGTRLQIFLDHQTTPLFDMPANKFISEVTGPFPYPLISTRTYPGSQFPIPFAKHCRIQLTNDQPVKKWGLYWQITYTTYPAGTRVQTLTWPLTAAEQQELKEVTGAWLMAQKYSPPPPAQWTLQRTFALAPGERRAVSLSGVGVIRQLRVALAPPTPEVIQGTWLRMRWDGRAQASVDVPVGFFFGHGYRGHMQGARYDSLLMGVTDSEAYALLPMPYNGGAVIELENRSNLHITAAQVKLEAVALPGLPPRWGRFHATWHQRAAALSNAPRYGLKQVPVHILLERQTRGKYVGALLHLDWPKLWQWWGEGDVLIWTDENTWPPSYHGTGTEEYFNSGWTFFDRKAMSGYVSTRPGGVALYTFHLNDAFQFSANIRVAEETMGSFGGDETIHASHPLWGSTALWYAATAQGANSTP